MEKIKEIRKVTECYIPKVVEKEKINLLKTITKPKMMRCPISYKCSERIATKHHCKDPHIYNPECKESIDECGCPNVLKW